MSEQTNHRPPSFRKSNDSYRGRPHKPEKEKCIIVSLSIPTNVLNDVEQNIAGVSRSQKLVKCIRIGHERLVNKEKLP